MILNSAVRAYLLESMRPNRKINDRQARGLAPSDIDVPLRNSSLTFTECDDAPIRVSRHRDHRPASGRSMTRYTLYMLGDDRFYHPVGDRASDY